MPPDPLPIVCEYLEVDDPQIRRNAVTALAALGRPDSLEKLLQVAAGDALADVRANAEREILELDGSIVPAAVAVLRRHLSDAKRNVFAYAMLGKLRAAGTDVGPIDGSVPTRLRRVWGIKSLPDPTVPATWRTYLFARCFWAALGSSVAIAALLLTLLRLPISDYAYLVLLGAAPALAATVGWLAACRATPIQWHYDRAAAAVTEILSSALRSSGVFALLASVFIVMTNVDLDSWPEPSLVIAAVTFIGAVVVGAIRAGTIISAGVSVGGSTLAVQTATGAALGLLVLTALIGATRHFGIVDIKFDGIVQGVWFTLVPATVAVAMAFATVDGEEPRPKRSNRSLRLATYGILMLASAMILWPVARIVRSSFSSDGADLTVENGQERNVELTLPFAREVRFEVPFLQRVVARFLPDPTSRGNGDPSYEPLRLLRGWYGETALQEVPAENSEIDAWLEPGAYRVSVRGDGATMDVFQWLSGQSATGNARIVVRLNVGGSTLLQSEEQIPPAPESEPRTYTWRIDKQAPKRRFTVRFPQWVRARAFSTFPDGLRGSEARLSLAHVVDQPTPTLPTPQTDISGLFVAYIETGTYDLALEELDDRASGIVSGVVLELNAGGDPSTRIETQLATSPSGGEPTSVHWMVSSIPARYEMEITAAQKVRAEFLAEVLSGYALGDFILTLERPNGVLQAFDDPPRFEEELAPGRYGLTLDIVDRGKEVDSETLPSPQPLRVTFNPIVSPLPPMPTGLRTLGRRRSIR